RGYQGAFDSKMIMGTTTRPLIVGDEIWVYYGGWDVRHHYPVESETSADWKGAAIGLAKWRIDGFVAMINAAGRNPELMTAGRAGTVTTGPIPVDGSDRYVNAEAAQGAIEVGVCDGTGPVKAIPGFEHSACVPIDYD